MLLIMSIFLEGTLSVNAISCPLDYICTVSIYSHLHDQRLLILFAQDINILL